MSEVNQKTELSTGNNTNESENVTKKRNRWGSPQAESNELCVAIDQKQETSEDTGKSRRSRFSSLPEPSIPTISAVAPLSQEVIQLTIVNKLQLQKVNEKLITVVKDALEQESNPNRSPSPPPRYDSNGKRTNTREVRMREALMKEKGRLIEELLKLNPTFQAPADFVKSKPSRKLYLPKQTNPLFNYIGLIIGPRGNTQKQMETATNCKISIRGKGSAKEGSKNRSMKQPDDDDELHVYIQGEEESGVEKAVKMIEEILVPQDDSVNEHKQKQLRELALINGTLREDEYCPVCGEKGHRQFECPHRARSFKAAGVKCSICGDLSHPTRDCPLKQDGPTNQVTLDSEYDSFMAELTEGPSKSNGTKSTTTGDSTTTSNGSASGGTNKPVAKASGPIYVAPIVELIPTRKANQTVIHVTTMMTGLCPPVFAPSTAVTTSADGTTVTAPVSTGFPSIPGYPSAPPTAAGMPAQGGWPSAAPGGYAGYPGSAYGASAYPSYPNYPGYPPAAAGGMYPGGASGYGMYGNGAPPAPYNAALPPVPAPAPAVPPPPPSNPAPPPAPHANTQYSQFQYTYPSSK